MKKVVNYQELKNLCIKNLKKKQEGRIKISVVLAKCSVSVGAEEVLKSVRDTVEQENMENVIVEITGCMGLCSMEPIISVNMGEEKFIYGLVTPEKARTIIISHGLYGKVVEHWVMKKNI